MNILILTPYLPYPLNSGGAQGMYNMIDNLRHRHHFTLITNEGSSNREDNRKALQQLWPEVDIIYYSFLHQLQCPAFVYEKTRRILLKKLAPNSRQLAVEMAVRPYGEWFSAHHVNFVRRLIDDRHIDLVQVEFFECLPWVRHLPSSVRRIFIHHELGFVRKERLLSHFQLSHKERAQLAEAKRMEFSDLERYDAVVTVTATDKATLEREGLHTPVYVSTLAINTPSFPYSVSPGQLTFIGGFGHLPNKEGIDWFTTEVAPLLRNQHLTLDLIGNSWPSAYAKRTEITICLRGFIENLSDVALGSIMIVPILSGSGMRMKILEAAAMSLPIVTTTVGVEGLDFEDGHSCLVADTPEAFAKAIQRLCEDDALRRSLGEAANRLFQVRYHPSVLAGVRDKIYQQVMQK